MLQVFHMDVAKVDLDVTMLQAFHMDVASVLDGAFSSRDSECSMQHEIDVAAGFFCSSLMDGQ